MMIRKKTVIYWISLTVLLMINSTCSFAQHVETSIPDSTQPRQHLSSYIAPSVLLLYGFLEPHVNVLRRIDNNTNLELREDHPSFANHLDNYFRYAPAVAVYGMDALGLKAKHNVIDRSVMLLIAGTINSTAVSISKNNISRMRPNGTLHSFPSGHTAMAFMTAEFMHQEYKDNYPVMSYLGYATATATGILRLYNGAHWVSDVVTGAGYGILSTKISYLVYPMLKRLVFHDKPVHFVLLPVHQSSYNGLALTHAFN
jgi:membrane-associated phospholipid phosphatase